MTDLDQQDRRIDTDALDEAVRRFPQLFRDGGRELVSERSLYPGFVRAEYRRVLKEREKRRG